MILRNWINLMSLNKTNYNKIKNSYGTYYTLSTMSNGAGYGCNDYKDRNSGAANSTNGLQWGGICLGSGTTSPTVNDIDLESTIYTLTDDAHSNNTQAAKTWEGYSTLTFEQQVTNNTASPITITEVGVYAQPGNSNYYGFLFTRDTISPVTIGVGESKTFIVTIDLADMSTNTQTIVETE